jgi:hypothetical protein
MLSTVFSIIPIIIDTKKLERLFISSQEKFYYPIIIDCTECVDCDTVTNCISLCLKKYITNIETQLLQYRILSCTKTDSVISINYAVVVPDSIELKNCYIKNYNISVLHPLVRKALAYA